MSMDCSPPVEWVSRNMLLSKSVSRKFLASSRTICFLPTTCGAAVLILMLKSCCLPSLVLPSISFQGPTWNQMVAEIVRPVSFNGLLYSPWNECSVLVITNSLSSGARPRWVMVNLKSSSPSKGWSLLMFVCCHFIWK